MSSPYGPLADALERLNSEVSGCEGAQIGGAGDVLRRVRAAAVVRPVLVVLEDVHWADPDSLAAFDYLSDSLEDAAVLCVITARDAPACAAGELISMLHARRTATVLTLEPLADDDVRAMLAASGFEQDADQVARVVRLAEGVPFLVEELAGEPGVPRSFAESITRRLGSLSPPSREVVWAAAVLGRRFDWRLLAAAADLQRRAVPAALEEAVAQQLVDVEPEGFQFRHALTREAVLASMLPPLRVELAQRLLDAVDRASEASDPELAADLARQADHPGRAAELLVRSGERALRRGALATAIDTLRRARTLSGDETSHTCLMLLVEALALAGRLDECLSVGVQLLGCDLTNQDRLRAYLAMAGAAVEASRWSVAAEHRDAAQQLLDEAPDATPAPLLCRLHVVAAEIALAKRDLDRAQSLGELVIASGAASEPVRCQALMLLGRRHRARDLEAARGWFERGLRTAEAAGLPVWRLRALHELGTIDLFDRAGTERLRAAHEAAEELGAMSTAAVLDIQLAAAHLFRFQPADVLRHGHAALGRAERLGIDPLRATALVFIAEGYALLCDVAQMEQHIALAMAAGDGDAEIAGSAWGARGVAALLAEDRAGARAALTRAEELLAPLVNSGPAPYRGLWPLLLAVDNEPGAPAAVEAAAASGIAVNRVNRGLLGLAGAVLCGNARPGAADELADRAMADLVHFTVWGDIARYLAAPAAVIGGWGRPTDWLASAQDAFAEAGLSALVQACRAARRPTDPLAMLGITPREREVLGLLAAGLSNKDIAARLTLSTRTVEKHVESLLRRTGARSRTQLATMNLAAAARIGIA